MNSHFRRGRATFTCSICRRRTRETGQGSSDCCNECYELAGLQNAVYDTTTTREEYAPERDRLLETIIKRGGDPDQVKREFYELWS